MPSQRGTSGSPVRNGTSGNVVCTGLPEGREAEVRRHHADDRVWFAVDEKRLTEDGGVAAEAPCPQPVRQHGHACVALLVGGGDAATQKRRPPEQGKERPRHLKRRDALGAARGRQVRAPRLRRGQIDKRCRQPAVIPKVGRRHRPADRGPVQHGDQAVGLVIGQRLQQHALRHGPQRGQGRDAERQRQGGGGGMEGIVANRPQALDERLTETVHREVGRDCALAR